MLRPDEYDRHGAVGRAALVANGEVTAAEVAETAIARIQATEQPLSGVIATCFEDARHEVEAGRLVGPLAGVPFLVKDLNTWVRGMAATNGSRALAGFVPEHDSGLVGRLRAVGLVLLGKTNTPAG